MGPGPLERPGGPRTEGGGVTDPYEALGLPRTATDAQIKAKFRKLTRKLHPDLHPGDAAAEEAFKAISVAHDLLGDPETRRRFDAGEIDAAGAERPPRRFYRDFAEAPETGHQEGRGFEGDPGDIFAEILRQRGRPEFSGQGFSARGSDLRFSLEVPFLDAVRGARTRIALPDGSALEVAIPEGSDDGQTLRLRGRGAPGFGDGPPGDALVTLAVRPHPVFRRDGADILVTLPITIDEAILGGKVATPTIAGPVSLTIPKGASSGQVLRLRGRGVVARGAAPGDQRVDLRIVAPPAIDAELAAFMEGWRRAHPHDPRAKLFGEEGR